MPVRAIFPPNTKTVTRCRPSPLDIQCSPSHDLILGQATVGIGVHAVACSLVDVFDKAEVEGSAAILISLEFGDGRLRCLGRVEPHYASASRSPTGLVLNLSLLDLADGREELDQIVVTRRPWKLEGGKLAIKGASLARRSGRE